MRRLCIALVLVLVVTLTTQASAAIPENTIIMGDKAYDLSLLNDTSLVSEILAAFIAAGNSFVYKAPGGTCMSPSGQVVSPATLPAVTYRDANKVATEYAAGDGGVVLQVSVSVAQASVAISPGQTSQIQAVTSPTSATLTYSSSNTSVATVSSSGLITGVAVGSTSITVTATKTGYAARTASVVVTVNAPGGGPITFTFGGNVINEGSNKYLLLASNAATGRSLGVTTTPSGATLTYSSSNTSVATVSTDGKVTGVNDGQATITVTASKAGYPTATAQVVASVSHITSVSASSGWVTVTLSTAPAVAPGNAEFSIREDRNEWGARINSENQTLRSYDAATRTAVLSVTPVTHLITSGVRYVVSYCSSEEWLTVVLFPHPGVSSVTGVDGRVTVVLDWVPVADPIREDFVVKRNFSDSSTWETLQDGVHLAGWDRSTRTVALTTYIILATIVDQHYKYSVSYKGGRTVEMTDWITIAGVVIPIDMGPRATSSLVTSGSEWHLLVGDHTQTPQDMRVWTMPEDAAVTYSSSSPSVATVDDYGQVTGINDGTATITVTASRQGYTTTTKTVTVTVSTVAEVTILAKNRLSIRLTRALPIEPSSSWGGIRYLVYFYVNGDILYLDADRHEYWGWVGYSYSAMKLVSWSGTTAVVEIPSDIPPEYPSSIGAKFRCSFMQGSTVVESPLARWSR